MRFEILYETIFGLLSSCSIFVTCYQEKAAKKKLCLETQILQKITVFTAVIAERCPSFVIIFTAVHCNTSIFFDKSSTRGYSSGLQKRVQFQFLFQVDFDFLKLQKNWTKQRTLHCKERCSFRCNLLFTFVFCPCRFLLQNRCKIR